MTLRSFELRQALAPIALIVSGVALAPCVSAANERTFVFVEDLAIPEAVQITPEGRYNEERGFGYLDDAPDDPEVPRVFAVDVPEGNYEVSIRFGDAQRATSTTVKAETRRLMLEEVETERGEFETRTFTVNVRRPEIGSDSVTRLNGREQGPPMSPSWDKHLTLEFNGESPGVAAVRIRPDEKATTVFLAGDSTVTDQRHEPWAAWGQMLPRFFGKDVAVSNHAESGLALHSFESQKRLEKVLSMMKKGDYLFIQFGHNDQKDTSEGAGPFTSYKKNLKRFVEAARGKGGIPVLLTPMERRRWQGGEPQMTLSEYAEAVRQVGSEESVPVIDLHAMSLKLYGALGEGGSKQAFVFYPAGTWPGQGGELKDNTHHSAYGAYELARCVVEGIRTQLPALAEHLADDVATFDPSRPDRPDEFELPPSPAIGANEKPAGN